MLSFNAEEVDAQACPLIWPIWEQAVFRPELLNRIDEIVTFRQLSASNLHCIAQLLVQEVSSRMQQAHGTSVQLSQRLLATIVDASAAQVKTDRQPLLPDLFHPDCHPRALFAGIWCTAVEAQHHPHGRGSAG